MSAQTEKLQNNLARCRNAVLQKGGTVGSLVAFDNLPQEILTIPSEGNHYILEDNSATAFRKDIPSDVESYIKLKSLGGMTYKRHKPDGNLLPYPYIDNTDTQGTFIFNKISDDWLLYKTATLVDSTNAFKLPKGTYVLHLNHSVIEDSTQALYSPSGYVSINGDMKWVETGTAIPYATFTFDTETLISNIEVYMEWMVDMVVDNPIVTGSISPVLYREGEAVTFTPRQMELVDTKVTAIRSYGADGILKANYLIPEALQGTGKGIEGYSDTTDFENGKDIKRCDTNTLTGDELWGEYPMEIINGLHVYFTAYGKPNGASGYKTSMCSHFSNVNTVWSAEVNAVNAYSDHPSMGGYVYFKTTIATLAEWTTYLSEQYASGNPVTVTYAVAEPIETDLTETISTYLKVEEGGYIEFANDDSKAVPSSISYLRRI